jgi:hypothetical protein
MTIQIQSSNDLLNYLADQAIADPKKWYGFLQQKITGIVLVHAIAANHADKMTPYEIVEYVTKLNNEIHNNLIKKG